METDASATSAYIVFLSQFMEGLPNQETDELVLVSIKENLIK